MRSLCWTVVAAVWFPAAAAAQQDNPFTALARTTFEREQATGRARGFEPLGDSRTGLLLLRERDSIRLHLEGGWEYLAVGICDEDCRDLYFYLLDQQDKQIAVDVWRQAHPRLQLKVESTANYTLAVAMGSCSVEPCYYSVQLFRKALAP